MLTVDKARIGVIGLGYVGLPLAVEFGKVLPTIGYDINQKRVDELRSGKDNTLEVDSEELATASQLSYADSVDQLKA
jgi:UDP-N-acetyl-D-galactosamine dehydrogenase